MNYHQDSQPAYFPQQQPPYATNGRPFGSFSSDVLPSAAQQNLFAADDIALLGYEDGNDGGDPKRRRIARACDMCRKKKIKCDGKMPACTHCQNYKTECIFTQVEKKRNPPKGAKYIEGLENRLGRMEALLRLSGLLNDEDADATDLQTLEKKLAEKSAQMGISRSGSTDDSPSATPVVDEKRLSVESSSASEVQKEKTPQPTTKEQKKKKDEEVEALSEAMCSLVTNNYGDTRYIGSSSGFSIFSPKGVQWVNEKTGDRSFQSMVTQTSQEDNRWIQWRQDVFADIFQRRVYQPLPPKEEALSLLRDYFTHFNCMFPLFHEATFMALVERHYSRDPYEGSGWWASLNVALATAHRLRVMSQLVPAEEDHKAWGYLKNALAVQTELTIRNTDLLSIQALLGMAMFLMGTPNPQPSFFLVAAALRLAHSLGLHKKGSTFSGLDKAEIEQRQRVYWIAYMLDKDICLRSGRPPIQDDEDMNVELPSEDPEDNIGNIPLADGKGKVNLFRTMCSFAVIASKVYKRLYSVKASKQTDGELLNNIGVLDKELEDWKDNIPIDFRPEHEIKASHTPLVLHVVVLHFAYYNCLTTIHRMSVHHGYWTSRLSNYAIQGLNVRPLNPRVFSSAALCVAAARASIQLIKYLPQGDFDCVWLVLYYPVSALVTLFANILQNPQDTRARSDLKLMEQVVQFLSLLATDDSNSAVRTMLNICSEFARISKVVLEKSEKDSSSRRGKRKQQELKEATETSPAAFVTPRMSVSTPAVYGNIPNVFSPPSALANKFHSYDQDSPSGVPIDGYLSPPNAGSPPMVSGSSPIMNPATTSRSPFNFNLPSGGALAGQIAGANGVNLGGSDMGSPGMEGYSMGMAFQQPFLPQDLWQMPMTLEWDWADMTSGFGGPMNDFAMGGNGGMRQTASPTPSPGLMPAELQNGSQSEQNGFG